MTNRERLNEIRNSLGWSQKRLAEELSRITGDQITLSTVQRWLAPPDKRYASPCPGWPIAVLDSHAATESSAPDM